MKIEFEVGLREFLEAAVEKGYVRNADEHGDSSYEVLDWWGAVPWDVEIDFAGEFRELTDQDQGEILGTILRNIDPQVWEIAKDRAYPSEVVK